VSGSDWSFDKRSAVEAYRSHARSHEALPLWSNQQRNIRQGWGEVEQGSEQRDWLDPIFVCDCKQFLCFGNPTFVVLV
jgi:hypothetical protein